MFCTFRILFYFILFCTIRKISQKEELLSLFLNLLWLVDLCLCNSLIVWVEHLFCCPGGFWVGEGSRFPVVPHRCGAPSFTHPYTDGCAWGGDRVFLQHFTLSSPWLFFSFLSIFLCSFWLTEITSSSSSGFFSLYIHHSLTLGVLFH